MKSKRIFLQPGQPVEIINQYGTSVLKITAMFERENPFVVTYEQPGVPIITSDERSMYILTDEPLPEPDLFDHQE